MISDEDRISRVGRITASRIGEAIGKLKTGKGYLKAREDYKAELVLERLTGKAHGIPMNMAMQYGVDTEPYAIAAYEAQTGVIVSACAFTLVEGCDFVGASPDGLVGEDGGLEVKAPFNPLNHMYTLLDGMPSEHMAQIQCGMWATGRKWWDFVSYDPRMPDGPLRLYIQRIPRDDDYIAMMHEECSKLNREIDEMVERLRNL
jgi:hypothetical protein